MDFDISAARLYSQQLAEPKFTDAVSLVKHFGAIQAQDYPMSKWAVGARLPGATDASVEKALDDGEIIRTHVLRPTWHLAAAEDIRWMLELTGDNVLRQMNGTNKLLGLDAKIFTKSNQIIAKAVEGNNHLTRDEIMEIVGHSGINTHSYRGLHILLHAELTGIICSGIRKGKNHSYALFDERIGKPKPFDKQHALAELAKRYLTSHGPATQKDFAWWSWLPVADSKKAIELNKDNFIASEFEGQTYYHKEKSYPEIQNSTLLLPAFDEFLIAYKDRSASIHTDHTKHAFTSNGIFRPIIVINGQVAGTWKRTVKKDKVIVEFAFLRKIPKSTEKQIGMQAERFADFLGLKAEILI